jgi:hypothetical protein
MHSIRRKFRGSCILLITQRNHVFPLTRFTALWRSEIRINLKIDLDALNRRWRRFCVSRTIYHIY